MQKVGDVCECCRDRWEQQDLEPRVLKAVNTTENKGIKVTICTWCDGDAYEVFQRNAA